jgi:hypothetical protein
LERREDGYAGIPVTVVDIATSIERDAERPLPDALRKIPWSATGE